MKLKRLQDNECFSHFNDSQLERLEGCCTVQSVPAGEMLLNEGDSSHEAYLLEQGRVRLQRDTSYGHFTLATLADGELFGEISFVDRNPRSVDVVTETDCRLLVFSPERLAAAAEGDKAFTVALYWAFWKSLSKKLRASNEQLSRFFTDGSRVPTVSPGRPRDPSGEFRVDMVDKRRVFQEQKLSSMEINFLASLSKAKKLRPGEVLFREGDLGDRMYVVLDGKVMISKLIPGAGEEALAFLERGDFFGEMALIDKVPRSADAKAGEGGAVVLAIPHEVLAGILGLNKLSSVRLLRVLCVLIAKRIREVNEKIVGWYILSGGSGSRRQNTPG